MSSSKSEISSKNRASKRIGIICSLNHIKSFGEHGQKFQDIKQLNDM